MATIELGDAFSSNVVGVRNIDVTNQQQFGAVTALAVMEPLTVIPALENLLARSYTTVGRVAKIQNRIEQPIVRFSLEEMHQFLDFAAVEVSSQVRAEFLKGLQTEINPSSNAFDISDKLRVLGSRVKVGTVIAKRLGIYQFRDLDSRGITFSDTNPVWTAAGGEVRVYGDSPIASPNPTDAEAAFISLPETAAQSNGAATFDGTTGIVAGASVFNAERDTFLPILLDDGVDTAWAYIASVTNATTIVLGTFEDLTDISTGAGAVTITWTVPAYYKISKIIENLVILLAASDLLAAMGEFDIAAEYRKEYEDALRGFVLPVFRLPVEEERNE
jgi:hypothetical protein